ncbi:MAG: methyl-accepting chemotaxis protein [Desulfobacterales bacterium]|nr:methyl-accepting chemotaxis protein [Desulfobacterales bacterium]
MMTKKKLVRKRYFIKKDYQFNFIMKFCLLVLAGAILSSGLLFFFSQGTLTSSFENSRLVIKRTSFAIMPMVIYTNLFTLIFITVATIAVVLFISHRIAGPMFRFEKDLKEIAEGNLMKTISLRKKDQFMDMANNFNLMTTELRKRILEVDNQVLKLMASDLSRKTPGEHGEDLERLHSMIHENFRLKS